MFETTLENEIVTQQRLLLPESLAIQIERESERAYPEECCGILIGVRDASGIIVNRVVGAKNVAAGDRCRQYQVDWESLFQAVRQTRDSLEEIVGFYHSHPDGSCKPSISDLRDAWIDYSYVIVGVTGGEMTAMASWRVMAEGAPFSCETLERKVSR